MRIGICAEARESSCETPLPRNLERMIVADAGGVTEGGIHDIRQDISQGTARQRCARPRIGCIDIEIRVDLPGKVGYVCGFQYQVQFRDLLLDAEVTLLRIAGLVVRWNNVKVA